MQVQWQFQTMASPGQTCPVKSASLLPARTPCRPPAAVQLSYVDGQGNLEQSSARLKPGTERQ